MTRTRIKICGMTSLDDARAAAMAGADAVGFVFVHGSSRYIDPAEAWEIVNNLPPLVHSVGVFVNASLDTFSDIEEQCPTTYTQLQGSEPEKLVKECGPGVFKGIRYSPETLADDAQRWNAIEEVDAIVIEAPSADHFDFASITPHLHGITKPIILSGALSIANVGDAIRALRPYAVDVTAAVEREPGRKDPALMAAFCQEVRAADLTR